MAGDWTDRDRDDLEFGWGAHRRDNDQNSGRFGREGAYGGREGRTFENGGRYQGRSHSGRVFGEGGYPGEGPSGGYSRPDYQRGARLGGGQDYTRPDRFFSDEEARERMYRADIGDRAYSPTRAGYHARGYGEPGFDASGNAPRTERTERFEDAGRNAGDFLHRAGEKVASWFGAASDDYERQERNHRGKGPKSYKRSDERIADDVNERLTDDRWLDASEIDVAVVAGEVTLNGAVEDREAKHRAERIAEEVSGVRHVQNNLRVGEGAFFQTPRSSDDLVSGGTGGSGAGQSTAGPKV